MPKRIAALTDTEIRWLEDANRLLLFDLLKVFDYFSVRGCFTPVYESKSQFYRRFSVSRFSCTTCHYPV